MHAVLQGALMVNDDELLQGFSKCRELGALPQVCAKPEHPCMHVLMQAGNSMCDHFITKQKGKP